ncbi:MAG: hypothetical protein P4L85_14260 [Paludisphaera borealis]|uniref:hypothetical protein n=1 Tax=Paludisphaera borealis TaxID=1387353 RepID=UPI00283C8DA6|nr:hypothetical protein [Paludisphaera borealis]MDR3620510.1 hypothetical protein [Paludisphaera borealis]
MGNDALSFSPSPQICCPLKARSLYDYRPNNLFAHYTGIAMRKFNLIAIMILQTTIASAALAEGWEKYGVEHQATEEEMAADQAYGGYPNNKLFNNDTKCSKVVKLFDTPGMDHENPKMTAFLNYAAIKLAGADILEVTMNNTPSVFERMGLQKWKALPALYPAYCRKHPHDTLDTATMAVYKTAQLSQE